MAPIGLNDGRQTGLRTLVMAPAVTHVRLMEDRRYATPTGEPCPRCVREDGAVDGSGDCGACGCCLLLPLVAWPEEADTADRRP